MIAGARPLTCASDSRPVAPEAQIDYGVKRSQTRVQSEVDPRRGETFSFMWQGDIVPGQVGGGAFPVCSAKPPYAGEHRGRPILRLPAARCTACVTFFAGRQFPGSSLQDRGEFASERSRASGFSQPWLGRRGRRPVRRSLMESGGSRNTRLCSWSLVSSCSIAEDPAGRGAALSALSGRCRVATVCCWYSGPAPSRRETAPREQALLLAMGSRHLCAST